MKKLIKKINRFQSGNRILYPEDLDRNGWKWIPAKDIREDDPLKNVKDLTDNYLANSEGWLVPTSDVYNWINSYEAQTPYQEQSSKSQNKYHNLINRFKNTPWKDVSFNSNYEEVDQTKADDIMNGSIQDSEQNVLKYELSQNEKNVIYKDIIGRQKEYIANKLSNDIANDWYYPMIQAFKRKYGSDYYVFSKDIGKVSSHPNSWGVTYHRNDPRVAIRSDAPYRTLFHEFRHALQDFYGLSLEQEQMLLDAYDHGLLEYPFYSDDPEKNRKSMINELPAINTGGRVHLFEYIGRGDLNGKGFIEQNPYLEDLLKDDADLSKLEEALMDTDGYTQQHIILLKQKYKNNPYMYRKVLQNIVKCMMYIGENKVKQNQINTRNIT